MLPLERRIYLLSQSGGAENGGDGSGVGQGLRIGNGVFDHRHSPEAAQDGLQPGLDRLDGGTPHDEPCRGPGAAGCQNRHVGTGKNRQRRGQARRRFRACDLMRVLDSRQDAFPSGRSAIVGAATFGMGSAPGFNNFDLAAHASIKALAQVGLTPKDVDGLAVVVMDETMSVLNYAEYLGIQPRFVDNTRTGGSSVQLHARAPDLDLLAGQLEAGLDALR